MTPIVTVDEVSKSFTPRAGWSEKLVGRLLGGARSRTVHAVDGVSLQIRQGEVLALVGESGCGKSTLGRVIAGIHAPTRGSAALSGQPLRARGAKTTTRVQMVFQDPFASLDPRARVGQAIAEGPVAHGLVTRADAPRYVREWLQRVGLPADAAERYPHQFSGGQRQRVAIARALAMQPEVLVCDEPVASLDVSIQAQIINLFLELREALGLTMLFISHDLGVVRHLCDRVAVMYLGRIVECGPTEEIYAAPRHPYTQALLASIPRLTTHGEAPVFRTIAGELPSPIQAPPGCHFHTRCPLAAQRCRGEVPRLLGTAAQVACFYPLGAIR